MSFSTIKFMGASVVNCSSRIGWGVNQLSETTVTIVEDEIGGDAFVPISPGEPAYLTIGSFTFNGLVQKYGHNKSQQGELYEVTLVDPRVVLDAAHVIMGGFNGSTAGLENLYNVYGYWENTGFGNSFATDAGMPWSQIKLALMALINGAGQGTYGGPLLYGSTYYKIDLSELPEPSADYRINSPYMTLLELISYICEDAGCDFFVDLSGAYIRIRVTSRVTAPPLGTITNYIDTVATNNVSRSQTGLELRNETNSKFLVGGDITTLYTTDAIYSFWGFDASGAPILGTNGVLALFDATGAFVSSQTTEFMTLNASPVADVVGDTVYDCSTFEMRLAMAGQDNWVSYMVAHKPDLANAIGIRSFHRGINDPRNPVGSGNPLAVDALNDDAVNAVELAAVVQEDNINRLYEFVRTYGTNYYGKKFAVAVPQVYRKIDSDTGAISYNYDMIDAAYLPEGSTPLGLATLNQNQFTVADGRFVMFAQYVGIGSGYDLTRVSPDDVCVQVNSVDINGAYVSDLYTRAMPGENGRIVFNPDPYVIMETPFALQEVPEDMFGGIKFIDAAMNHANTNNPIVQATLTALAGAGGQSIAGVVAGIGPATAAAQMSSRLSFGTIPVGIAPQIIPPNYAAIPLKSNVLTYGPWTAVGAVGGKVDFEQDGTLVPWNYGGFDGMNAAAAAKLANAATNTRMIETGVLELPGLPAASLGDVLQTGGPNITNINIQIGEQGVTTSYMFQTYTPRFGVFNKGQAEKIRRVGQAAQLWRRELKNKINEGTIRNQIQGEAYLGAFANMNRALRRQSPHTTLIGQVVKSNGQIRTGVASATSEEALIGCNPHNSEYVDSVAMSLAGLVRPASTKTAPNSSMITPLAQSSGIFTGLGVADFNPFKTSATGDNTLIDFLTVGTGYKGLNTHEEEVMRAIASGEEQRFLALRGPVMLTGYGPTVDGKVFPTGVNSTTYHPNTQGRPDLWKTAPLELHFDQFRGVWTMPRFAKGVLQHSLVAGSSAPMTVYNNSTATSVSLTVNNFLSSTVSSGSKIQTCYDPNDNKWWVVSADC